MEHQGLVLDTYLRTCLQLLSRSHLCLFSLHHNPTSSFTFTLLILQTNTPLSILLSNFLILVSLILNNITLFWHICLSGIHFCHDLEPGYDRLGACPGFEPKSSRTQSKNHTLDILGGL